MANRIIHDEWASAWKYQMYDSRRTKTAPASSAWTFGPIGWTADRMATDGDRTCIAAAPEPQRPKPTVTRATESPRPSPPERV